MQMKQARTEANSRAQPKNHQIDEDESKKDDGAPLKRGEMEETTGKDYG